MDKKKRNRILIVWGILVVLLLVGVFLTGQDGEKESMQVMMNDAVLHNVNHIRLLGLEVNPALISAILVNLCMLTFAAVLRIFVIPKFTLIPGKLQLLLEEWVGLFRGMAKNNAHHKHDLLGAYIFAAGSYIFVGTCFELFGVQAVSTHGFSIALPAPLADINGAIGMGVTSYLFLMLSGIYTNGFLGVGRTLKEFSLPISMSFRLFGALLSGLLVTELVYYTISLSFVLPVFVGVMFTLLHALIQAYVLTMLTAMFFGEITEPVEPKPKKEKVKKEKIRKEKRAKNA